MKRIQRIRQQGLELVGRGDKTDALTENLIQIERKVEGIRNGAHVTSKKLTSSLQGSGSTAEKHQKKLPLYSVGSNMKDAGIQLCSADPKSAFGGILGMVGQAELEMATQIAQYEIMLVNDVITPLTAMLEEDTKKVEKTRKRLQNARLDMDSARGRLQSAEKQAEKSNREYQMGKLDSLRADVDEATKKFEDCQDAYATELFTFMSKEQLYTEKLQEFVRRQVSMLKQGVASLEGMLPTIEKRMKESQERPLFGMNLTEHRKLSKKDVAVVIQDCVEALRDGWLDTEGLFRIAGSATKVKFLKNSFNAHQRTAKGHDPHTIAGCLKRYIRELPEPILTFELYSEFMQAVQLSDHNTTMQKLKELLDQLPEAHTTNLKYLLAFLHEFSLYHETTKMTIGNIAIVMGPNLLWSQEEMSDAAAVVSDTATQRRVTELLIEHVHWFYPDLPETPLPSPPQKSASLNSTHGTNPSGVYTPTASISTYGTPPPTSPSPAVSTPSSSTSSSITEDLQAHTSPLQTTPPLSHNVVEDIRSSSPKPVIASPPIPPKPYRGTALQHPPVTARLSNPPSPAPRSGSFGSSTGHAPGSDVASQLDSSTNGVADGILANQRTAGDVSTRPCPTTRKKLELDSTKTSAISPSHGGVGGGDKKVLKGPSRKAPPPPTSRKPGSTRQLSNEEVSAL